MKVVLLEQRRVAAVKNLEDDVSHVLVQYQIDQHEIGVGGPLELLPQQRLHHFQHHHLQPINIIYFFINIHSSRIEFSSRCPIEKKEEEEEELREHTCISGKLCWIIFFNPIMMMR